MAAPQIDRIQCTALLSNIQGHGAAAGHDMYADAMDGGFSLNPVNIQNLQVTFIFG